MSYIKNKKPIESSSTTFAYILGVVLGDGHVRTLETKVRTGGRITLQVMDKDFALVFKDFLEEWSGREAKIKQDIQGRYCTNLYSKYHADFFKNFSIENVLTKNRAFKHAFLKGLFDSDGGIVGKNSGNRRKAKRWLHFSNSYAKIIYVVKRILNELGIKYSFNSRIHSGFGSKRIQYEIKIYNLQGIYYYYKNIGFNIQRKQLKLKETIDSYTYYSTEVFNRAKELHKTIGFKRVAKEISIPENVVYRWLFKNYKGKIIKI